MIQQRSDAASPPRTPRRKTIVLASADCFFTETIALPPGIAPHDIANFVECALEELAPFPLEQLHYGCLWHPDSPHILLHAAWKNRLRSTLDAQPASHLLPAHASLYGLRQEEASWFFHLHQDTLSALLFLPHDPIPTRLHTLRFNDPAQLHPAGIFNARQRLLETMDTQGHAVDCGIIHSLQATPHPDGTVTFHHTRQTDATSPPEPLPDNPLTHHDALWLADIRDKNLLKAERRTRRQEGFLWRAATVAASATALLATCWMLILATQGILGRRHSLILSQAPLVQQVLTDERLSETVSRFTEESLRPFDRLDILNRYRPSNNLYFTSLESTSHTLFILKGLATSVPEVNQYTENLRKTDLFRNIETTRMDARPGEVNFTLSMDFKPLPPPDTALAALP